MLKPNEMPIWVPDTNQANAYTIPTPEQFAKGFGRNTPPDPGLFNYLLRTASRWIQYLDDTKISADQVDVTKAYVDNAFQATKGYADTQVKAILNDVIRTLKGETFDILPLVKNKEVRYRIPGAGLPGAGTVDITKYAQIQRLEFVTNLANPKIEFLVTFDKSINEIFATLPQKPTVELWQVGVSIYFDFELSESIFKRNITRIPEYIFRAEVTSSYMILACPDRPSVPASKIQWGVLSETDFGGNGGIASPRIWDNPASTIARTGLTLYTAEAHDGVFNPHFTEFINAVSKKLTDRVSIIPTEIFVRQAFEDAFTIFESDVLIK